MSSAAHTWAYCVHGYRLRTCRCIGPHPIAVAGCPLDVSGMTSHTHTGDPNAHVVGKRVGTIISVQEQQQPVPLIQVLADYQEPDPAQQNHRPGYPRPFVLLRETDHSGVSGTGVVAEGVEFSDGVVALRWTSASPTSVVFHDKGMQSVEAVHGHNGATRIEWM